MVVLAATNCAVENDGVRVRLDVCIRTQFALVDGASALRSGHSSHLPQPSSSIHETPIRNKGRSTYPPGKIFPLGRNHSAESRSACMAMGMAASEPSRGTPSRAFITTPSKITA